MNQFLTDALPSSEESLTRRLIGLGLAAVCFALSLALGLAQLGIMNLPGCSPPTDCNRAFGGTWAGMEGWPSSFLGLAYFAGVLLAWTFCVGAGTSIAFRMVVRCGAVVSALLLIVSVTAWIGCLYCFVIHVTNLAFWVLVERTPHADHPAHGLIATFAAGAALTSASIAVVISEQQRSRQESLAFEAYQSQRLAIESDPLGSTTITETTSRNLQREEPKSDTWANESDASHSSSSIESSAGTTDDRPDLVDSVPAESQEYNTRSSAAERHYWRDNDATAQLLVFCDYGASGFENIDRQLRSIIEQAGESVSVTFRHFPMCSDCNLNLGSNPHPNSCRAAFAVEAAGLLKGEAGFTRVHQWLVDRRGNFTDDELRHALRGLGPEGIQEFMQTMNGEQVLSFVLADIVEARAMNVTSAPAVFLNGTRLPNPRPGAELAKVVAAVLTRESASQKEQADHLLPSPVDDDLIETFPIELQRRAALTTVRIVNADQNYAGSGIAIARRGPFVYVLTAYHVVPKTKRVQIETFFPTDNDEPNQIYPWASVIAGSAAADLALIRFSTADPIPTPLPFMPLRKIPTAERFPAFSVGCTSQDQRPICLHAEVIDSDRVRRSSGDPASEVWQVAQESAQGRSGGPLIDASGHIIGIASGNSSGNAYFSHTRELHEFLRRNGMYRLIDSATGSGN